MSIIIFDIGGTGARCAAAGLCALTAGAAGDLPNLGKQIVHWHVDKDETNGTASRSKTIIGSYQKWARQLGADAGVYDVSYKQWNINTAVNNPNAKLKVTFSAPGNQRLMDMLFGEDDQKRELANGFEQRPALGALYFERIKDQIDTELGVVLNDAKSKAGTDAIFIFGSVFGGSGAAMIHNLAKYVRKYVNDHGWGGVKIGAALLLPYFEIPPLDDKQIEKRKEDGVLALQTSDLMLAAQKALHYYASIDDFVASPGRDDYHFDAFYPIGMRPLCNNIAPSVKLTAAHYHEGKSGQGSAFSVTDLIAAQAMCDFLRKANDDALAPDDEYANIFVAVLGSDPFKTLDWSHLPNAAFLRKKLLTMTKFALFVTTFIYPEFKARLGKQDKKAIKASSYGKWFAGNYTGTDVALEEVYAYCYQFLRFIEEVAGTVQGKTRICDLFDVANLGSILTSLDTFKSADDDEKVDLFNSIRNDADTFFNKKVGGLLKKLGNGQVEVPEQISYSSDVIKTAIEGVLPAPNVLRKAKDKTTVLFRTILAQCAKLTEEGIV